MTYGASSPDSRRRCRPTPVNFTLPPLFFSSVSARPIGENLVRTESLDGPRREIVLDRIPSGEHCGVEFSARARRRKRQSCDACHAIQVQ